MFSIPSDVQYIRALSDVIIQFLLLFNVTELLFLFFFDRSNFDSILSRW
jgi:hypothetical protein